jgi:hypothetical protein
VAFRPRNAPMDGAGADSQAKTLTLSWVQDRSILHRLAVGMRLVSPLPGEPAPPAYHAPADPAAITEAGVTIAAVVQNRRRRLSRRPIAAKNYESQGSV